MAENLPQPVYSMHDSEVLTEKNELVRSLAAELRAIVDAHTATLAVIAEKLNAMDVKLDKMSSNLDDIMVKLDV